MAEGWENRGFSGIRIPQPVEECSNSEEYMTFKNNIYKRWSPTNKIMFGVALVGILFSIIFFVVPWYQDHSDSQKRDTQAAEIYKMDLSRFWVDFKVCLRWMLPLNSSIDEEVDAVFHYGSDFLSEGVDLQNLKKEVIVKIFRDYRFERVMPNYSGSFSDPTGFKNLLGILGYLDKQLKDLLSKYGGSMSPELSTRIEYMQRSIESAETKIRLDLASNGQILPQGIDTIADLIVLMRDDFLYMDNSYPGVTGGGYPIAVGTVTKSDPQDGSILFETWFSNY